jgi:acetyl esterase/lipase
MKLSLLIAVLLLHFTPVGFAQTRQDSLLNRFDQVDRNGDGKVTARELPRPILFQRLDRNGDGVIERDEVEAVRSPATRRPMGADAGKRATHLDIPYTKIKGVDPNLLSLDIYSANDPRRGESRPVMVYVHGGGWRRGDKSAVGRKAEFFAGAGWVFVSVNYRLVPQGKHPRNAEDVATALAWVHDHAGKYGGNSDSIFLMGHSAGCHLASLVATDGRHLEKAGKSLDLIKGVIALDTQAYDVPSLVQRPSSSALYVNAFGKNVETQRDASPIHHVARDKGIPAFLICYSSGMTARVNPNRSAAAKAFAAVLKEAGVAAEVVDASDRNHGQINQRFGDPADEKVTGKAMAFIEALRRPKRKPSPGKAARTAP